MNAASEFIRTGRRRGTEPRRKQYSTRYMGWNLADALRESTLAYCSDKGINAEIPCRASCLYVMQAGEYIKVGVTVNPWQRMGDLQCANPVLIQMRQIYVPPADIYIKRIEQIAHRALQMFRVRGEWFTADALRLFTEGRDG